MKKLILAVVIAFAFASLSFAGLVKNPGDLEDIQGFAPSGTITSYVLSTHTTTLQNWPTSGYTAAFISCFQTTAPQTAAYVKFGNNSSVTNFVPGTSFGPYYVNKNTNGTYNTKRWTFSRISTATVTSGTGITCTVLPMP